MRSLASTGFPSDHLNDWRMLIVTVLSPSLKFGFIPTLTA